LFVFWFVNENKRWGGRGLASSLDPPLVDKVTRFQLPRELLGICAAFNPGVRFMPAIVFLQDNPGFLGLADGRECKYVIC